MMFGMLSTCFEPQNTRRSHHSTIFVNFQQQCVKIAFYRLKKCSRTHVNRNTMCRFVCVCRTHMRQRAFESPEPGLHFKYLHHRCWMHRKVFTGPQSSEIHFFLALVYSVEQNLEISRSQKSEFWWSKWLEKIFRNKVPSTGVPGLEASWKHPKLHSFMFQTP